MASRLDTQTLRLRIRDKINMLEIDGMHAEKTATVPEMQSMETREEQFSEEMFQQLFSESNLKRFPD